MLKAKIYSCPANTTDQDIVLIAEYKIDSVDITRTIREFSSFSFEIKAEDMAIEASLSGVGAPVLVVIERDTEYIIEGLISTLTYNKTSISVQCEDILFALSFFSQANRTWYLFRNCQVGALFRYFLTDGSPITPFLRDRQFELGNFFTAGTDLVKSINFDGREANVLTDWFFRLMDSMRHFYYQLGSYDTRYFSDANDPKYRINVGDFSSDSRLLYNEDNITDISIDRVQTPNLQGVFGFGDTYEQPAGTQQVLSITSGATTGYESTMFVDIPNEGLQFDLFVADPYKRYENFYPDVAVQTKITPGANMRAEASESIYSLSAAKLREGVFANDVIHLTSNEMPFTLRPGNKVNVKYDFVYQYFNAGTQKMEERRLNHLDNILESQYFIQGYDLTVYENDLSVQFSLVQGQNFDNENHIKLSKKQIKKFKKNKEYFVARTAAETHVVGIYELTIGSGLASNTTLNGNPARSTVVSKLGAANFGGASSIPVGATPVVTQYICTNPEYEDRVNLDFSVVPAAGVANFTIVTQFDDNWTTNDAVEVKILVFFNV